MSIFLDPNKSGLVNENNQVVNHKKRLPSNLANIIFVAKTSLTKWQEKNFTLEWITTQDYEQKINRLDELVKDKSQLKTSRTPVSSQISELNKYIDEKTGNLKGYLIGKYGHRDASSHYGRFGIIRKGRSYVFPRASEERRRALDMLVSAIEEYELPNTEYGLDFWVDLRQRYHSLIDSSSNSAGDISVKVAEKNQLAEEVLLVMNSLISLVRANYPKTWDSDIRAWGFQKEKY